MTPPLLDFSGLPRFAEFDPAHAEPAIDQLVAEGRAVIEGLARQDAAPTWETFVEPLDDANERLARVWAQVTHLNAVVSSPQVRAAYNAALPKVTQYFAEQGQDQRLHAGFKALAASPGFAAMAPARRRHVENQLRDFRLGGAELPPAGKARFLAVQEEMAKLGARFQDNVLDATNDFGLFVEDRAELAGIPEDVLATAAAAALKDGRQGWKLTLHNPCYQPVMQYAGDRGLRERIYRANFTRASEFGRAEWDNEPVIARILELRGEAARLLGYERFAEVSLASNKMAGSPAEALAFLGDLAGRTRPFALRDMEQLREFARSELGMPDVLAWDVPYVTEKLRQARYAYSDQEVKQYFPEDAVLGGLFGLVETLYGVRIRQGEADVYHPTVRFFEIADGDGARVGRFYLDLYAREGKRGGAWMHGAVERRRRGTSVQTPVAFLTCNFSAPVGGKPALFTHREVITLFHEFGHGLHQLLTQVDELGVSGINGVEWDAVELPSQFMENFCWQWDVVAKMARHVETGERIPRALFDKLLAARNFQGGMGFVRQLEFALFDMRLHAEREPGGGAMALLERVREEVAVCPVPGYNRFPNQFMHIFAGGYAAGYYSYKWAEVLSADAFAAFEEGGVLDPEVGGRFRREVLARGGSRPALDSFVAFRGRKPRIDALLRHNGMTATA